MCVASTSVTCPSRFDGHASGARPAAPASHGLHFIFAEEKLDALGVLVDDAVLARQHGRPIQLEFGDFDAEFLGILERVVDFRVVQQNLGRDAADVQAGASQEAVFLDDQSFQAPLRGADGGHVTARPAADDGQIVRWQEQPPRHTAARIGSRETERQTPGCLIMWPSRNTANLKFYQPLRGVATARQNGWSPVPSHPAAIRESFLRPDASYRWPVLPIERTERRPGSAICRSNVLRGPENLPDTLS